MKSKLPIVLGVIGAVLGFGGTMTVLALAGFGNAADPIMSGLIVLVVIAPLGALAGLVLGAKLGMAMRGGSAGGLAANSLKALAVVIVLAGGGGGLYYVYDLSTATPWLNPNAATPLLQFEVRLPAGAALPASARDVKIELQTDKNSMPGELHAVPFRRDGDRPVISGEVELAYRTANRQLELKIAGQPARLYRIGLTDMAPHTPALGPWQPHSDGSEIRYRAKWPGKS